MIEYKNISSLLNSGDRYDLFPDSPGPDAHLLQNGLIPPVPILGEEMVWGFPLVRMAPEMKIGKLAVLRLECSPLKALETALRLENRCDSFSWVEKMNIYNFLEHNGPKEMWTPVLPLVQSGGSFIGTADKYRALPEHIRNLVASDLIDLKTARSLSPLSPAVAWDLAAKAAGLTFSERRQLFTWVYEIICRDSLDDEEGLKLVSELWADETAPVASCREKRFPELTGLENKMRKFTGRHVKGSGIDLRPPPNFEGERFEIRFSWRSDAQLDRSIRTLDNIRKHSDELYRLLYPAD